MLVALLITILFYSNTMFYTLSLLFIVIVLLSSLVSSNLLSPLTGLILSLVYIGAIIILIGYICAISPNLTTSSATSSYVGVTSLLLTLYLFITFLKDALPLTLRSSNPLAYLYSFGYPLLLFIVLMLFVTLLIVTCQYSSPRGPFRAL